jgi:hypothetical protein
MASASSAQREITPMSGSSLGASIPILSFDPIEQVMFVGFAGLKVETAPQIQVIFDAIDRFWTRKCAPDRVYGVIDYPYAGSRL